jgi:hypothetical protein
MPWLMRTGALETVQPATDLIPTRCDDYDHLCGSWEGRGCSSLSSNRNMRSDKRRKAQ